jgi:hypothetical protein
MSEPEKGRLHDMNAARKLPAPQDTRKEARKEKRRYLRQMRAVVRGLIEAGDEFSSNDVWDGVGVKHRNGAQMLAGVMAHFKRLGWCEHSGDKEPLEDEYHHPDSKERHSAALLWRCVPKSERKSAQEDADE